MNFLCNMFSFKGFMDRGAYWKCLVLYIWVPALFLAPLAFLAGFYDTEAREVILVIGENQTFLQIVTWILAMYLCLAFTWCSFAIMAKRLRDFNVSPYFCLLYILIPLIIILYGLFPTNVNAYER